jgi:predicted metal-binding membrane protein
MSGAKSDLASGRRSSPATALLLSAAVAWAAVVAVGRGMGAMSGTMGFSVLAFVAVWSLMMAAMMLPGVAPFASFYARTFTEHRKRRLFAFASGYLLVWAAVGLPAFALAWVVDRVVADHATPPLRSPRLCSSCAAHTS